MCVTKNHRDPWLIGIIVSVVLGFFSLRKGLLGQIGYIPCLMFLDMMAIFSDDTRIVLCLREDLSMILIMYACMMLSVGHSFFSGIPGVGNWRVCMSLP